MHLVIEILKANQYCTHTGYQEIQWNPSVKETIGNQHSVPYSVLSLTHDQGLPVYSGGRDTRNRAVEHNVAAFHM